MTPESFNAVLNTLVPPNPERGIPGAGDAGVAPFVRDGFAKDAELAALLEKALIHLSATINAPFETLPQGAQFSVLRDLENIDAEFFAALIRLTYMGYYSRPDIRGLLGLSTEPAHPMGYDVPGESPAMIGELTAPVVARGKVYRDVE